METEEKRGQEQSQENGESTQDPEETAPRHAEREQDKQLDEGTENPA